MAGPLDPLVELVQAARGDDRAPTALATVTGTTGTATRVLCRFDIESAASSKPYTRLSSYTPTVGDRVLLIRTGSTWTVLGKVV